MFYNGIDLGSYLNAYEYKGVDDIPISTTMWSPTLGDGGKISLFRRPTVTVTLMAVIETDEARTRDELYRVKVPFYHRGGDRDVCRRSVPLWR